MKSAKFSEHPRYSAVVEYLKTQVYDRFPQEPNFQTYQLFFDTGNRQIYENGYFERRKQLTILGLLLFDDPTHTEYKNKLENLLFSICNEFTWCLPAHVDRNREERTKDKAHTLDLFACETAYTLAELESLLGKHLSSSLLKVMRASIFDRVLQPFLDQKWNFEKLDNNWSAVCSGSIGAAALYLMSPSEERSIILNRVNQSMDIFLSGFGRDGACVEGLSYWQYGFRYFTYYIDLLKQKEPTMVHSYFSKEKICSIAQFQQKMTISKRKVFNFSDSPEEIVPAFDLASYYHRLFPKEILLPDTTWEVSELIDHCGRWAPAFRTLLWDRKEREGQSLKKEQQYWLEDAQVYIYKDDRMQFAAKGGHNGESHNHNDLGHFILYSHKEPLVIDLGAAEYTKDYFNGKRYDFIQTRSKGHSVPIINDQEQLTGKMAHVIVNSVNKNTKEIIYDLTHAYTVQELVSYKRTFSCDPENVSIHIKDQFVFENNKNSLEQRLILSDMELKEESLEELLFTKGEIGLTIILPKNISGVEVEKLAYSDHYGKKKKAKIVRLFSEGIGKSHISECTLICHDRVKRSELRA